MLAASIEQPLTAVLLNVLTAAQDVSMDSQTEKDSQQTVVMEEGLQQDHQESQQPSHQVSQQSSQEEMQETQQPSHQESQEGANGPEPKVPEVTSKDGEKKEKDEKEEEKEEDEEWPPKFPSTLAEFGYRFNKGEPSAHAPIPRPTSLYTGTRMPSQQTHRRKGVGS